MHSGNKHIAKKTEKLMATIPIHLLEMALEVDKKVTQWTDQETSMLQHLTEHIICDWIEMTEQKLSSPTECYSTERVVVR